MLELERLMLLNISSMVSDDFLATSVADLAGDFDKPMVFVVVVVEEAAFLILMPFDEGFRSLSLASSSSLSDELLLDHDDELCLRFKGLGNKRFCCSLLLAVDTDVILTSVSSSDSEPYGTKLLMGAGDFLAKPFVSAVVFVVVDSTPNLGILGSVAAAAAACGVVAL